MSWAGYFTYDGNELINVERTETYCRNAGASWFLPVYKSKGLSKLLGDGTTYQTPQQDNAPWVDTDDPNTYDFYGTYPLDVSGVEDSSRTSVVVESIGDGGLPGKLRHATKTIVFNTVLVGKTEAAVEAGFKWLKQLLLAGPCTNKVTSICNGSTLCYLSAKPSCGPAYSPSCLTKYQRNLLRVVFNAGPTINSKQQSNACGGAVAWQVQFTGVAGIPWEFGQEQQVAYGFLDPGVVTPVLVSTPFDATGVVIAETPCPAATYQPVVDPLCPAVIPPPGPPSISVSCFALPTSWKRRKLVIPETFIPLWADAVPYIAIHAVESHVRNLRLRFYPDPSGAYDPSFDPCDYCGDMVISYVPQGGTLVIDGTEETVYYVTPDGRSRRADSLVFATDGSPFVWPSMSCGYDYIFTIDTPSGTGIPMPYIDLSVFSRAA